MSTPPHKSDANHDAAPAPSYPEAALPIEPGARSELLVATHVFVVEIRAVQATPWAPADGGLRSRKLDLQVALVETLKGTLHSPDGAGATFPLQVEQKRERNPMGDHPGLYSHLEIEPGKRFVFVSRAAPDLAAQPANLMREGPVLQVFPGSAAAEVHLARGIEHVIQAARRAPGADDPDVAAARAAIALVASHLLDGAGDVAARYLWARIQPTMLRSPARPVRELVALLTAHEAANGLRIELIAGLDAVAQALGADPAFVHTVASGYLTLLSDPGASALHQRLVDVSLYLLLFPGDERRFPVDKVFPDAAERARYRAALAPFSSDRARKLAAWLSG